MMESAFILVAATKDRSFVEEKLLGEITDWRRRAIKAFCHADPPQSATFPDLDKLETMIRADYVLKGRKFRVEDIARIAELDVHYAFEYFLLEPAHARGAWWSNRAALQRRFAGIESQNDDASHSFGHGPYAATS